MEEAHFSVLLLISVAGFIALPSIEATAKPQFTAMFVFGDSLNDPGNNIYFINSIAKANFWPYGIDSGRGPAGRFCNGKILIDFLAELLGLPLLPSYASTIANGADILSGVNYASAGAGILQDTGKAFGRVIPLSEQIGNFKTTLNQLREQMQQEELSNYLAKALAFVDMGANDYINNYLFPDVYQSSHICNPTEFADLLIKLYFGYLSELHSLGLRKFFISEVAPVGCTPLRMKAGHSPPGECESNSNNLVEMFNSRLKPLVLRLNKQYPGSVFTLLSAYQVFIDLRNNAHTYGFKVTDTACCGLGRNKGGKLLCPPNAVPCYNRDEYIFWDAAHPTQAANRFLAQRVYNNTSFSFPVNLLQMANM